MENIVKGIDFLLNIQALSDNYSFESCLERTSKEMARDWVIEQCVVYLSNSSDITTIEENNVHIILEWLLEKSNNQSINTIHAKLDALMEFKKSLPETPIDEILTNLSQFCEIVNWSERTINQRYSLYRSLARYIKKSTGKNIKIPIHYKHVSTKPTQLLKNQKCDSKKSFNEYRYIELTQELTGIRLSDIIAIELDDIFISNRIFIHVKDSKGGICRTVRSEELSIENQELLHNFFNGRLSTGATHLFSISDKKRNSSCQLVRYHTKKDTNLTTHGLRRLFVNILRAMGETTITIANLVFHGSIRTLIENYVLIYPALQREQLLIWLKTQTAVFVPIKISVKKNSELNRITESWLRELYVPKRRCNFLSIGTSISILEDRIKKTINM